MQVTPLVHQAVPSCQATSPQPSQAITLPALVEGASWAKHQLGGVWSSQKKDHINVLKLIFLTLKECPPPPPFLRGLIVTIQSDSKTEGVDVFLLPDVMDPAPSWLNGEMGDLGLPSLSFRQGKSRGQCPLPWQEGGGMDDSAMDSKVPIPSVGVFSSGPVYIPQQYSTPSLLPVNCPVWCQFRGCRMHSQGN